MTDAASNEAVLTMDRHQYETGEGPCLDAKTQGRWFYSESFSARKVIHQAQGVIMAPHDLTGDGPG